MKVLIHALKESERSNKNSKLDVLSTEKIEKLEEFDQTRVEPLNFVRSSLLDYEECLSYL